MRIELGNNGSKTTIHRYLKEIEDFDPRPRASRERLSDELTELVAGLLARMTEEGGEAIAHAQGVFDEQRVALEKSTKLSMQSSPACSASLIARRRHWRLKLKSC